MKILKVLIGCEESQIVCIEFRKLGHEAYSCDLQECSGGHPEWHIQMDVFEAIEFSEWDLMIMHPPCTYLANSGVRWLYNLHDEYKTINPDRWTKMEKAAYFFKYLLNYGGLMALENPIMHKHAKKIIGRKQDQIIHPWQFGHGEMKATCLWLNGLPELKPTDIVDGREQRIWKMPPSKDRQKLRSKTYQGIGRAMAVQWSEFILNQSK